MHRTHGPAEMDYMRAMFMNMFAGGMGGGEDEDTDEDLWNPEDDFNEEDYDDDDDDDDDHHHHHHGHSHGGEGRKLSALMSNILDQLQQARNKKSTAGPTPTSSSSSSASAAARKKKKRKTSAEKAIKTANQEYISTIEKLYLLAATRPDEFVQELPSFIDRGGIELLISTLRDEGLSSSDELDVESNHPGNATLVTLNTILSAAQYSQHDCDDEDECEEEEMGNLLTSALLEAPEARPLIKLLQVLFDHRIYHSYNPNSILLFLLGFFSPTSCFSSFVHLRLLTSHLPIFSPLLFVYLPIL
jgi:hypothetical protein